MTQAALRKRKGDREHIEQEQVSGKKERFAKRDLSKLSANEDGAHLRSNRDAMAGLRDDPAAAHDLQRMGLDEGPVSPTLGQFVIFCTCIALGIGMGVSALIIAWAVGLDQLSSLAVYFALATALILGAAVIFAHRFSETYDVD